MTARRRIALAALLLAGCAVLVLAQGCPALESYAPCKAKCQRLCLVVEAHAADFCTCDATVVIPECKPEVPR